MLKLIRKGDIEGIKKLLTIYKLEKLENIVDHYGELDFSEEEQEILLKLFETDDVSILRRINPILMAILCN